MEKGKNVKNHGFFNKKNIKWKQKNVKKETQRLENATYSMMKSVTPTACHIMGEKCLLRSPSP